MNVSAPKLETYRVLQWLKQQDQAEVVNFLDLTEGSLQSRLQEHFRVDHDHYEHCLDEFILGLCRMRDAGLDVKMSITQILQYFENAEVLVV